MLAKYPLVFVALSFSLAGLASATALHELPESYLCIDAESGLPLAAKDADVRRPPASMVKLLMLLLADEGVEAGQWRMTDEITVSAEAQRMGGTQVYLEAGDRYPLGKLLEAIAVASANDAAVAVAEGLWGSKEAYLEAANRRARELGMADSTFHSVHGLPPDDRKTFDLTTAHDMALLARACVARPRILGWSRTREIQFKPGQSTSYNTNKLIWRMPDCDGLKTGYIRAAGFCVTATAEREGVRLISVVMGSKSKYGRFNRAEELMDQAFAGLKRQRLVQGGSFLGTPLPAANSDVREVRLRAEGDIWANVPESALDRVRVVAERPDSVEGPLPAGTEVGEVVARLGDTVLGRCPLVLAADLPASGWRLKINEGRAQWHGLPDR